MSSSELFGFRLSEVHFTGFILAYFYFSVAEDAWEYRTLPHPMMRDLHRACWLLSAFTSPHCEFYFPRSCEFRGFKRARVLLLLSGEYRRFLGLRATQTSCRKRRNSISTSAPRPWLSTSHTIYMRQCFRPGDKALVIEFSKGDSSYPNIFGVANYYRKR